MTNLRQLEAHYICRMRFSSVIFLALFLATTAQKIRAQEDTAIGQSGRVTFLADSSIINLEKSTRKFKEIKGYRIQIFLGPLEQVKTERNNYLALNLPYSAYMKQIVPEHALQIGDFTTKMEMDKCLSEIEAIYPKAFGVVEIIEPPKYSKKNKASR